MNKNELLAEYENKIQNEIDALEHPTVDLLIPYKATVKRANGSYSKISINAGEKFRIMSCYTGKRNGLIFVMKPVYTDSYAYMEMSAEDAMENLSGVAMLVEEVTGVNLDETFKTKVKEKVEETTQQQFEERQHDYGDTYGSW